MKYISSFINITTDSIKDTNSSTLELWNQGLQTEDIIQLENNGFLVDMYLYLDIVEAARDFTDIYKMPNVNFSIIDRDDKRWDEFKQQRLQRGFDSSETWNLDSTISQFIEPRLEVFKKETQGCPAELTDEEWDNILNKMLFAFHCINTEDHDHNAEVQEGLDLFRKYFFSLWW